MLTLFLLHALDGGVTQRWDEVSRVRLVEGQVLQLELVRPVTRLSASDPKVCEVTAERDTLLRLTARGPGKATVLLWRGASPKGLEVEVVPLEKPSVDAGVPFFTWDGTTGFAVPRGVDFVVQGPGGLERVAPGSHRRCTMTSIGNDQLRFRCADAGPVSVFLWYANNRQRTLELDVTR